MQLAGVIIFFGALFWFLLWLYKLFIQLASINSYVKQSQGRGSVTINILPGIILFIIIAISAGIAWG
jgi:hypothetical protein